MNKIFRKDLFGLKEVPDIFFTNINDEIIYCIDTVKFFKADFIGYGKWEIYIKSPLFHKNIDKFWKEYDKHYNIYCRTFKRNVLTGVDDYFCFKFSNAIIKNIHIETAAEGNPCNFPMTFISDNMEIIENNECPKILSVSDDIKEIVYPIKESEAN